MDCLVNLGIIKMGLTGYSSPLLLVKRKHQNLFRVCTDFRVLNDRLVHINHASLLVRDCIEAIGKSNCQVMRVLDLRDAYHTLWLTKKSQKFCGITPYYGSPTYYYLRLGMGISASPARVGCAKTEKWTSQKILSFFGLFCLVGKVFCFKWWHL